MTSVAQAAALASLEPAAEKELLERVAIVVDERARVDAGCGNSATRSRPARRTSCGYRSVIAPRSGLRACEERRVVVRAFAGAGVRVTIGSPEENDRFLAAAEALSGS